LKFLNQKFLLLFKTIKAPLIMKKIKTSIAAIALLITLGTTFAVHASNNGAKAKASHPCSTIQYDPANPGAQVADKDADFDCTGTQDFCCYELGPNGNTIDMQNP
jgi:hypothetical protein